MTDQPDPALEALRILNPDLTAADLEAAAPAPVTLVDLMALGIGRAMGEVDDDVDTLEDLDRADADELRNDLRRYATAALEAGRPPERPIVITTPAGDLALLRIPPALADPPRCDACKDLPAGVALRVRLDARPQSELDLMHVCGKCLAAGLAIAFGREHVRAGGTVEDLVIPDAGADE